MEKIKTRREWNASLYFEVFSVLLLMGVCQVVSADVSVPGVQVDMMIEDGLPVSYFETTLSNVPPGYDVTNREYVGWCVDLHKLITGGIDYKATLYSSYDPGMPTGCKDPDWDKVNYILNHKHGYHGEVVQYAIWHFINGGYTGADPRVWEIINDADTNGEGFVPGPGELTAVIIYIDKDTQLSFIEVIVPSVGAPEPTIAIAVIAALAPALGYGLVRRQKNQK